MKIRPFPIVTRYEYRPDLIPTTGSPLYDRKHERCIKPDSTVRVGSQYLKPKQIVYILHHPDARGTETEANPLIVLPLYLLPKDGDANNITIENLKPSGVSGRWTNTNRSVARSTECVEAADGTLVPKHLIPMMSAEQLEQFGLTLESIYEEGNPQYARAKTKPASATKPDDFDPYEGLYQ